MWNYNLCEEYEQHFKITELVTIYTYCNAGKAVFLVDTKILNYVAQVTYNLYIIPLQNTIVAAP